MMIRHHVLSHFYYVFVALDRNVGHRPNFVIPNFYEFYTQIVIYMSISSFLCANDVYLHFIHVWFCMLIFYRDKCQSNISLANESTNEFNALGICS